VGVPVRAGSGAALNRTVEDGRALLAPVVVEEDEAAADVARDGHPTGVDGRPERRAVGVVCGAFLQVRRVAGVEDADATLVPRGVEPVRRHVEVVRGAKAVHGRWVDARHELGARQVARVERFDAAEVVLVGVGDADRPRERLRADVGVVAVGRRLDVVGVPRRGEVTFEREGSGCGVSAPSTSPNCATVVGFDGSLTSAMTTPASQYAW
jgi:hypothetical protein